MAYLTEPDYHRVIQEANLQQIITADSAVLLAAGQTAQAEAISYLIQKYDTASEFADTTLWNSLIVYQAGARVYDTTTPTPLYYNAVMPAPLFNELSYYVIGQQVFWKGKVYTCIIATVISNRGSIQPGTYSNIPPLNIYPDDTYNGAINWGGGITYTIPAATALANTAFWAPGDTRNQQLVTYLLDISLYHLHSRITPRNVPEIRQIRYESAIKWLKMAGKGDVTAGMIKFQPAQGKTIRFGGNIKNNNIY